VTDAWLCSAPNRGPIIVRCDPSALTWFAVRQLAARKLGADPQAISVTKSAAPPSSIPIVEVRWVGSDYGGGMGPRRLQERIGKKWVNV
jgi:hypothetical protein